MKGQGLPVNAIVLAALAILVLVLLVGFTTGGLGKIFSGFSRTTAGYNLKSVQAQCEQLCSDFKNSQTTTQAKNSEYAKRVFWIDLNGNGKKDNNEILNCWDSPINVYCSVTIELPNGSVITCEPVPDKTPGDSDDIKCS